jgi:hydroxylamine reductase (hybrid-cluster protein)
MQLNNGSNLIILNKMDKDLQNQISYINDDAKSSNINTGISVNTGPISINITDYSKINQIIEKQQIQQNQQQIQQNQQQILQNQQQNQQEVKELRKIIEKLAKKGSLTKI